MPRRSWPSDLTPRMFWVEDQIEVRMHELKRFVARKSIPVRPVYYHTGDLPVTRAVSPAESGWALIAAGTRWTDRPNQIGWFRATVTVPEDWTGRPLALRFPPGVARGSNDEFGESMLYLNGEPHHGVDRNHNLVFVPEQVLNAGQFVMALQAWSGRAGFDRLEWEDPQLAWVDLPAEALVYDLDVLRRVVAQMESTSHWRVELLKLGEQALLALDWTHPGSDAFYHSVAEAHEIVARGLDEMRGVEGRKPAVVHVGHTHLDVAWLWTLDDVKLKTARSWSSALRLMEQYPDFRFFQSQPQLYRYIKETQPEIWEQVKQRVAEGRWEADGGMWVEADCNLTSGESLVRQFVHGIRFFRDELGVENVVLWLPDVFGYSWALPQIINKVGLRYFMTTKIAWSQFNRFPYDTFRWRGIDGTEILTHFITAPVPNQAREDWYYTYLAEVYPDTVKGNWDRYQQKEINQETLAAFGYGDGGGGPTRWHMEYIHRLTDVPGMPAVKIDSVRDYFRRLEETVAGNPRLPVWSGELYLESHRGTYTSQAHQKRNNRKIEFLLHRAELFAAAAHLLVGTDYPRQALQEAWEIALRNQFHDIIPGTSIPEVHQESRQEYVRAFAQAGEVAASAVRHLAGAVELPEDALLVFNPSGFVRSDLVEVDLPDGYRPVDGETGQPLPVQGRLVYAPSVPANGYRTYPLRRAEAERTATQPAVPAEQPLTVTEHLIETPHYRLELNEQGQISRLYDKRHAREVLRPGESANVLQAFEDRPLRSDAWNIDLFYQQKGRDVTDLVSTEVLEAGPERGILQLRWQFAESTITQRLTVYRRTPRIDFETHVDWQQSQVLLKVAFPVRIHANRATYEIQFGNVERPTHWNTSWDWARFETVGHKWVDLSEGGYGVSLLNDSKYGHDIKGHVMRLTLIKSGTYPDPRADRGEHRFTYSLYPHPDDWFHGGTAEQAYQLNDPLQATVEPAHPGTSPSAFSLVSSTARHVYVETVKQAEADDNLVVRVYEFANRRGEVALQFGRPVRAAAETNLLEEEPQPVAVEQQRIRFEINPYEIKTFRIKLS